MIRVGLIGGRGYAGEELLRLFSWIREYDVVYVGSRSSAGKPLGAEFGGLQSAASFSDVSPEAMNACQADAWIIAQDNGQAARFVKLIDSKTKVIDISSDFRFDNSWVYGLPQRNAQRIANATRVANPGCYATAVQLGLFPLLNWLDDSPPVAFGVSGFSGAGRTPNEKNDADRLHDNLVPYSLTGHGHEREISYQLGRDVRFMPHVAEFFRGISITLTLSLKQARSVLDICDVFEQAYEASPLVEVIASPPEISMVRETNKCVVGGFTIDARDPCRIVLVSVIDNLRKGAASQAIENLNLMFGLPSTTGLMS